MSSYTATARTIHKTLTAGAADFVTMDDDYAEVEVTNLGTAPIYFLVDTATVPTVKGDGTNVVPAGGSLVVPSTTVRSGTPTVVRLISSAACDYSVAGL